MTERSPDRAPHPTSRPSRTSRRPRAASPGIAHRTPVLTSRIADERVGRARCSSNARTCSASGAFKFRGACNAIAALSPEQQKRAASWPSRPATTPRRSRSRARCEGVHDRHRHAGATRPAMKVAATRGYGGEVVLYDRYKEDREAIGRRLAAERGLTVIPPYDHADVIAGQGTAALELFEEVGPLDDARSSASAAAASSPGSALAAEALLARLPRLRRRAGGRQRRPALVPGGPDRLDPRPGLDRGRRADDRISGSAPSRSSGGCVARHRHGLGRGAGRDDALPRRAPEDRGRADRLPRGRRRASRTRARRGAAASASSCPAATSTAA